MSRKSYIYCIRNKRSGKCYVGKSNNPLVRMRCHCRPGRSLVSKAIQKDGIPGFEFLILKECDDEAHAYEQEALYIAQLNSLVPNGYNLDSGGMGGKRAHALTRQKLADLNRRRRGIRFSDEARSRIREGQLRRYADRPRPLPKSEEDKRRNRSDGQKRRPPPSQETRAKLSASNRHPQKKRSAETKARIGAASRGRTYVRSEEYCRKLSEAAKRRWDAWRALKISSEIEEKGDIDR